MFKNDQKMRKSEKWNSKIDLENTKRLKEIIIEYGWPTFELVGKEGSYAAWLIAQHADHDLKFQKKCLQLIKQAVNNSEVEKSCVAYLSDRVLVHERKKQLYGTQFYTNKKLVFGPRPIIDLKNLDKRRKKMNLEPFNEYKKRMHKNYNKWKLKKEVEKKIVLSNKK